MYPNHENHSGSSSEADENLSILAKYDDIIRFYRTTLQDRNDVYSSCNGCIDTLAMLLNEYTTVVMECKRLKRVLDEKTQIINDFDSKLNYARRILDQEKSQRQLAEDERDYLVSNLT